MGTANSDVVSVGIGSVDLPKSGGGGGDPTALTSRKVTNDTSAIKDTIIREEKSN